VNSGFAFNVRAVAAVRRPVAEQADSEDFAADCPAHQRPESGQAPVAELAALPEEAQRPARAERRPAKLPARAVVLFAPGPRARVERLCQRPGPHKKCGLGAASAAIGAE
jgi:hypothetical protein